MIQIYFHKPIANALPKSVGGRFSNSVLPL